MTRFAIAVSLMCIGDWAYARQGVFAWPVEEITTRIESLSCPKLLQHAPEVEGPHDFVPRSEVPLRASEYAGILVAGASNENTFNKQLAALYKSKQETAKAEGQSFEMPAPMKKNPVINISREGMKRAWKDIYERAWKFPKHYTTGELAAIALHKEAFERLNVKALAMIGGIRSNAEIRPIAESIGMTLAQIIDGARAAIDALGVDRETHLNKNPAAAENLSVLWEEFADFSHLYNAYFGPDVAKRFEEPEVREFLAREIKFVRRWRMYERGALESKRDRSAQAVMAHRLIGTRLANNWRLLAREPKLSGRQISAIRDSLRNLRHDLIPYVPPKSLMPLDLPTRELMLSEALAAPLLLEVIRMAGATLARDIPRSKAPPVRPTFQPTPYKVTGIKPIDIAARRMAEYKDRPRVKVYDEELAQWERAMRQHQADEHELRYQGQSLYDAYEMRSQARQVLLTYMAFKDPLTSFVTTYNTDAQGKFEVINTAEVLQREAEAAIARAADGPALTPEMYQVIELAKAKGPKHLLREYARWMTYAYATMPKLFPKLNPPPRSLPRRKVPGEYRPPFYEGF